MNFLGSKKLFISEKHYWNQTLDLNSLRLHVKYFLSYFPMGWYFHFSLIFTYFLNTISLYFLYPSFIASNCLPGMARTSQIFSAPLFKLNTCKWRKRLVCRCHTPLLSYLMGCSDTQIPCGKSDTFQLSLVTVTPANASEKCKLWNFSLSPEGEEPFHIPQENLSLLGSPRTHAMLKTECGNMVKCKEQWERVAKLKRDGMKK